MTIAPSATEEALRAALLRWFEEQTAHGREVFTWHDLSRIDLGNGVSIRAVYQAGIWRPAGWSAALAIRTAYTPPGRAAPYDDQLGADGLLRYKFRGTDPSHHDNRALREAMRQHAPLIWLIGIAPGHYLARFPIWLIDEEPAQHQFVVAVEPSQRAITAADLADPITRRYVMATTRRRVHQPMFRARVISAYDEHCAVCKIHHRQLLDAAHIVGDAETGGDPVVVNGLSLCKIHHAAYDADLMGISPNLRVEVSREILEEVDGPMLLHGLQERHGQRLLWVPRRRDARPDEQRLAQRYERFLSAS